MKHKTLRQLEYDHQSAKRFLAMAEAGMSRWGDNVPAFAARELEAAKRHAATALAELEERERTSRNNSRRDNGQYGDHPRCQLCGKGVHVDQYWSDSRVDTEQVVNGCKVSWADTGIVLHERCARKTAKMTNEEAWLALGRKSLPTADDYD